jgi:hypothetical protein
MAGSIIVIKISIRVDIEHPLLFMSEAMRDTDFGLNDQRLEPRLRNMLALYCPDGGLMMRLTPMLVVGL